MAGPAMAKQAVRQMTNVGGALLGHGAETAWDVANTTASKADGLYDRVGTARDILAQVSALTGADRASLRRLFAGDMRYITVDDDLEAYASIKPWAKRAIQVDREIDRRIIERRSVFQRIVDGLDVHKSDVPDWWYFG